MYIGCYSGAFSVVSMGEIGPRGTGREGANRRFETTKVCSCLLLECVLFGEVVACSFLCLLTSLMWLSEAKLHG